MIKSVWYLWRSDRKKLVILTIFLCAIVIRLSYVLETRNSILIRDHFFLDPQTHDLLALKVTEDFFGKEPFFRAPLYPYFLGILYLTFGHNYLIPRLVQAFIGSISCVLLFFMGKKIFGNSVALLGALLASFYWILIYYDGEFLIPVLSVFLNLLLLLLLLRKVEWVEKWLFVAGLVLGLSAIARPNILMFLPCAILWITLINRRQDWKRIIFRNSLFLGAASIIIFSITIRNYMVGGDFVLISSQGGVNFFIGNNSKSDGKTPVQPAYVSPYEDYKFRLEHKGNVWLKDNVWRASKIIAEKALGRKLRPSEISRFWYKQAAKFIAKRPLSFIKLFLKKIYFLWNAYEIPSNDDIYGFIHSHSRILTLLSYIHFGIVGPLSLLGMGLCLKEWRRYLLLYLYVASYGLSVVLFFVTGRYRVPLLPVLLLFSAYSLVWMIDKILERRYRHLMIAGLILIALFYAVNSNLFGVREEIINMHYQLGW